MALIIPQLEDVRRRDLHLYEVLKRVVAAINGVQSVVLQIDEAGKQVPGLAAGFGEIIVTDAAKVGLDITLAQNQTADAIRVRAFTGSTLFRLAPDGTLFLRDKLHALGNALVIGGGPTKAGIHFPMGFSVGQLSDPFVITTRALSGGSLASGNYEVGITSLDVEGKESFAQQVTVNSVPVNGKVEVDIIPIAGAAKYRKYIRVVAGSWTKIAADEANTFQTTLTWTALGGASPAPPSTNATLGDLFANFVLNGTIPGGPGCFFLNLGQAENSQAAFFFSDHKGICASFQTKGTGGPAPSGGKSELDIAFNGDSTQILTPLPPGGTPGTKELDFFVENVFVMRLAMDQLSAIQNLIISEIDSAAAASDSRTIAIRGREASANFEWDIVARGDAGRALQFNFIPGPLLAMTLDKDGHLHLGAAEAQPTALLSVNSTTRGFLPPRMTTTQRDAIVSPATGLFVYNTTTNRLNLFDGTAWVETPVTTFLGLSDTPASYAGQAGRLAAVNAAASALEFPTGLILSGGNFGIGAGADPPARKLHVHVGTGTTPVTRFQGTDHSLNELKAPDGGERSWRILHSDDTLRWLFGTDNAPASTVADFVIKTANNADPEFIIKAATGRVGIANPTPNHPLDVVLSGATQIRFANAAGNDGGSLVSASAGAANMAGGATFAAAAWTARHTGAAILSASAGDVIFFGDTGLTIGNTFSPTELMRLKSTGRLGIGTTAPNYALDVVGADTQIRFGADAANGGGFLVSTTDATAALAGGTNFDGTNWIARATSAGLFQASTVGLRLFHNTGLTVGNSITLKEVARLNEPTDGETALLVRRNVGGTLTLQRVSMGAVDSGGSGFKYLRVPN